MTAWLMIMLMISTFGAICVVMKYGDSKSTVETGMVGIFLTVVVLSLTLAFNSPSSIESVVKEKGIAMARLEGLIECRYEVVSSTSEHTTWMKANECIALQRLKLEEHGCLKK